MEDRFTSGFSSSVKSKDLVETINGHLVWILVKGFGFDQMEERAILCFANCLKSQPQPFEDLFIPCFSLVESVSYLTNVIYVLSKSQ